MNPTLNPLPGTGDMASARPSALLNRLTRLSKDNRYDVFTRFDWPDALPADQYWLPPELLSVHGTVWFDQLSEAGRMRLSQTETAILFSVFAKGEVDLLQAVLARIHKPGLDDCRDYFHHFIDEENKHMWFFSEFCRRYTNGLYPIKKLSFFSASLSAWEGFLGFARIMIFEEIGDYFNTNVMKDLRVPAILRTLHQVHHEDESRHLAMGQEVARRLFQAICAGLPEENLRAVWRYLEGYMQWSIENFYNPSAYADAGMEDAYGIRIALLASPARKERHGQILARVRDFLGKLFGESITGQEDFRSEGAY